MCIRDSVPIGNAPKLMLTDGDADRIRGAALYFLRVNPKARPYSLLNFITIN